MRWDESAEKADGPIRSFRNLFVWQAGMDFVVAIYRLTATFPSQEIYGLSSQMQRAAVSVPANLAEGHTRESTREYLQHVSIAQGSLADLQTQLEIAGRLGYVANQQVERVLKDAEVLARRLYTLRNRLQERLRQPQR